MNNFRPPTTEELTNFIENLSNIDGETSWTPIDADDPSYEGYVEEDYEDEPMMWYFALEFFVEEGTGDEEETGEMGYNVVANEVSTPSLWSGFSRNDGDASTFVAAFPVAPGQSISLKELLDEMFNEGYDSPDNWEE